MKRYLRHISLLALFLPLIFVPLYAHAGFFDFLNFWWSGWSGSCTYSGDVRGDFKQCNPSEWLRAKADVDLDVQKRSDFREAVAVITRRIQIVASILAIAGLVFVGFLLVAPVKEETKTSAKKGFMYATVGFLLAIIASILVNAIVDLMYDIFG